MVFDKLQSWCSSNGIKEEDGFQKNQVREYCAVQHEFDCDSFYIFLKSTDENTFIKVEFYDINSGFDAGIMIAKLEKSDDEWSHSILLDAHKITLDDTRIAKSVVDSHTDYTFLSFDNESFNELVSQPSTY